mmetsp:Transcript_24049/g.35633  ORF Transcript_24049/g.35633 Transcript_24049/m.35633 type:complete len:332 (+) Transcript_24049:79-1074(+)
MHPCQVILLLFSAFSAVIPVTSCFSLQEQRRQPSFFSKFEHFSRLTALRMKRETGSDKDPNESKRLILIRHGCTFMNEYLATPGSRWGDANFTDIFHPSEHSLYRDSPLSNEGTKQAQELRDYFQSTDKGKGMIRDIELIAVSPLQRTLQTAEIAVLPYLLEDTNRDIPIVALPLASERVYLISDHGSCKQSLTEKFPFVDFTQEFDRFGDNWWFSVHEQTTTIKTEQSSVSQETHSFVSMHIDDYKEWRPSDENQTYSCHGEPDDMFEERMVELYKWLEARNESVICLVCHWGVLDWLTGEDFRNCEVRDISFDDVRARVTLSKATATQA